MKVVNCEREVYVHTTSHRNIRILDVCITRLSTDQTHQLYLIVELDGQKLNVTIKK